MLTEGNWQGTGSLAEVPSAITTRTVERGEVGFFSSRWDEAGRAARAARLAEARREMKKPPSPEPDCQAPSFRALNGQCSSPSQDSIKRRRDMKKSTRLQTDERQRGRDSSPKASERTPSDQNIANRRKTSTLHPILCFEQLSNQTGTGSFKILTGQKQRLGLRTRLLSQPTHLLPLGRLQSSSARQPIRDVPNLEHLCSTNGNTDLRQRNILTNKTTSGDTNHETHDEYCTRQYQSY